MWEAVDVSACSESLFQGGSRRYGCGSAGDGRPRSVLVIRGIGGPAYAAC